MTRREKMQKRFFSTQLETRDDDSSGTEEKSIEGYFAVVNSKTELWPGAFEMISGTAFDQTLGNDIRALINHDTRLVLGRNKSGTLQLKNDTRGLWGRIRVNENDSDAMNLYERVKRGDVDQCSFGFNVIKETEEYSEDGSILWTIEELDLHEVSVVTFPAYEDTSIQAREKDFKDIKKRKVQENKQKLKGRLNNVKTINA